MKQRFFAPAPVILALILILYSGVSTAQHAPANPVETPPSPGVYLPFIFRPAPNLLVSDLRVTQATQNPNQTVPLVQNRPAVAQVAVSVEGGALDGVTVALRATRDGVPLPGSPLIISPKPSGAAFEARLPSAWLAGTINLEAMVDPANAFSEPNEADNTVSKQLTFTPIPPLVLKLVPIAFTDAASGVRHDPPTEDTSSEWLLHMYPISELKASMRAPIEFTGDLSSRSTWVRLLDRIKATKSADGAPAGMVYYGYLPFRYCWGCIYAGLGTIGKRTSVGASDGTVLAHEVGHNFNRKHTGCAGDNDRSYPYPDGIIGQPGLDVLRWPEPYSTYSPQAKDVMTYCGMSQDWVSDYTYIGLYKDQKANGKVPLALAATEPVVMVRASFDEHGAAALLPVYAFAGVPTTLPEASPFTIELLASDGAVIADHLVEADQTAEIPGPEGRSIVAVLPLPGRPLAAVRLLRDGQPIATRTLATVTPSANRAIQIEHDPGGLSLAWADPDVPALVRFTTDGGRSWTTVGLDEMGGHVRVDPRSLPPGNIEFEVTVADRGTAGPLRVMYAAR